MVFLTVDVRRQVSNPDASCWVLQKCDNVHQRWEGFPGGTVVKHLPVNAGDARDLGSIPGSGRSPGEGNGNPLQYSCLENPMDRGAWWATVHGVAKSWTWLSNWVCTHTPTLRTPKGPKKVMHIHDVLLGDMIEDHFQAKIVGRTIMSLAKNTEYNIY